MFGWFGRKAQYWKRQYDALVQAQNVLHEKYLEEQQRRRSADRKAVALDLNLLDLRQQIRDLRLENHRLNVLMGISPAVDPLKARFENPVQRFTRGRKADDDFDSRRDALLQQAALSDMTSLAVLATGATTQPAPLDDPFRSGGGGDFGGGGASASWYSSSSSDSSSCDSGSSSDSSSSCSSD